MKTIKMLAAAALFSVCSSAMAYSWDAEEVFGDPIVTVEGNTVGYTFDEDAIYDMFADVTSDVMIWNNANANVTLYSASGEVLEVSHIGAWDDVVNFTVDLNLESGNYIVFDEGVKNVIANDEEEGETLASLKSPAYTYRTTTVGLSTIEVSTQQASYNLAGQLMSEESGLVIKNGKKSFVK